MSNKKKNDKCITFNLKTFVLIVHVNTKKNYKWEENIQNLQI